MATNPPRPAIGLTSDEIKALETAEKEIQRLHEELNKAESAGLDISDIRATLNEAEALRAGMLRVYGNQPVRRRP